MPIIVKTSSKNALPEKQNFKSDELPIFKFIPKKELLRKLIIKAAGIKNGKELKFWLL